MLSAESANAKASISLIQQTIVTNEEARAQSESNLQSQIDTSKAEISNVEQTLTTEQKAQATRIDSMSSEIDTAKANIKDAQQTIATNEQVQAVKNQQIDASFDLNKAEQQLNTIVEATESQTRASQYSILSAQTANSASSIQELNEVVVTNESATAESIKQLNSKADANSASITETAKTVAKIDGNVEALYTLKVEANGAISGIQLGTDGKEGLFNVITDSFVVTNGTTSQPMFIMKDGKSVFNGDLIGTGTISGNKLIANTEITAPSIKGGVIEGSSISIGAQNGDYNFKVDSDGNLTAKNGTFGGTIYAEKIVGDIVLFPIFTTLTSVVKMSFNRNAFLVSMPLSLPWVNDVVTMNVCIKLNGNLITDKLFYRDVGTPFDLTDAGEYFVIPAGVDAWITVECYVAFAYNNARVYGTYHNPPTVGTQPYKWERTDYAIKKTALLIAKT